MTRVDDYRKTLLEVADWDDYLMRESGLPGPRGNLELAQAAASLGDVERFRRYLASGPEVAPENTPGVFLVFVGVWGLGWQVAHGDLASVAEIRPFASDPRWRVREATAIALQTIGDAKPDLFRATTAAWATENRLEQRCVVAAVAEPRLLRDTESAAAALRLLDEITLSMTAATDSGVEANRVLRQALGYAWSVVVAGLPEPGKKYFEALIESNESDVRWIVRENLGKKRLERMDVAWVRECGRRVAEKTHGHN